jgi:hypothetical protein
MNTNTYKTNLVKFIGLAIMFCSCTMAYAQDQKFAIAAKQNAAALQQYTWKSQTQIRKEGDVKATKLYSNRLRPADGTVVQLLLQEESAKLPKFGIRGMVAKKKKADAQELIEALQRLAKSYGELRRQKCRSL